MSKLKEAIWHLVAQRDMVHDNVRFSITLQLLDDMRLKFMASELEMSKSGLAAFLITAALDDLEEELGLNRKNEESDYYKEVFKTWHDSWNDWDDDEVKNNG